MNENRSRKLVIGDIHGGLRALLQVLDRANVTKDDTLLFLGDYVDGWSESAELITYLISLQKKQECIFIRGNHDQLCYQWLQEKKFNPEWLQHGGQATIDSYKTITEKELEEHFQFYSTLLDYHIDSDDKLYLHAGFTNLHGPEHEYFSKLFYWDRTLWETALSIDPNLEKTDKLYPKRLLLFKEIYIGHTPVTRINQTTPVNAACIWNIDTGAAFKGSLTILDTDTKQFWQSDPVFTLYPDENGRN